MKPEGVCREESFRPARAAVRRAGAAMLATLLGVVLAVPLAGCGGDGPRLAALAPGAVVLAFGDSLTAGTGADPGEDYPAQLAALTGLAVVNAGVPGETSAQAELRLPGALAEHAPALVLVCSGGNDILRRLPADQTARHLETMVTASRAAGAQVLLIAVPRPGLRPRGAPFYAAVGQRLAVPVETQALARILAAPDLKADPIHPNAAGYAQLARMIAARLRALGALPTP